ncbi:MAG: hypothetical protein LBN93_06840 [Candidatus Symbiothrix sp.]|jgi:hypothetical protein|nr:hypothetical protein [Candidatus Symbiothrix sp.]
MKNIKFCKSGIVIFFAICLIACGQKKSNSVIQEPSIADLIDTSKIAILPYDTINCRWFFENCTQAELTYENFVTIESILEECIDNYNAAEEVRFKETCEKYPQYALNLRHSSIDLKKYWRQYIVVINQQGEKETFINFFCEPPEDIISDGDEYRFVPSNRWKTGLVEVLDGGNCFFQIKINLSTKKWYDFGVNGVA